MPSNYKKLQQLVKTGEVKALTYPNLKAEIARNGVSVNQVAETVEVSPKTVYNWLNGASRPDIEQAKKIKRVFFPACDLGYLFAD